MMMMSKEGDELHVDLFHFAFHSAFLPYLVYGTWMEPLQISLLTKSTSERGILFLVGI